MQRKKLYVKQCLLSKIFIFIIDVMLIFEFIRDKEKYQKDVKVYGGLIMGNLFIWYVEVSLDIEIIGYFMVGYSICDLY